MTPTIPALPSLKKQGGGGVGNHPNLLLPWPSSGMEAAGTTKAGTKRQESHPWLLFDVEIPLECDGIWWELSVCSLCKGWGQLFPSVFREQSPEGPTHPPGAVCLEGTLGFAPPRASGKAGSGAGTCALGGGNPQSQSLEGKGGNSQLCAWCSTGNGVRGHEAPAGQRRGQGKGRNAAGMLPVFLLSVGRGGAGVC